MCPVLPTTLNALLWAREIGTVSRLRLSFWKEREQAGKPTVEYIKGRAAADQLIHSLAQ